jgi:DNA-binding NarL/FixJ family response regulator
VQERTRTRLLLVDDHPIVRQGIAQLLSTQVDLEVIGEAGNTEQARELVAKLKPDLVLLDLSLAGGSGLNLLKELKELQSNLQILVLSMHDEATYAERVLRAGASGYVMKEAATDVLIDALKIVRQGGIYLSPRASDAMLRGRGGHSSGPHPEARPGGIATLSNRELEVFRRIGVGQGTREIAAELGLSVKTVETHRARIKDKLGVASSTELVVQAARWGKDDEV